MATSPARSFLATLRRRRGIGRAELQLAKALEDGREEPARAGERLGEATVARPDGPLIWLAAGSTSDALVMHHLAERLLAEREDLYFLITTPDFDDTSPAEPRRGRACLHQYLPYDQPDCLNRFLDHWKPDLLIWGDVDLRQSYIETTDAAGVPMLLINAQVPDDGQARLRWFPGTARALLNRFHRILAVDSVHAGRLRRLGLPLDKTESVGALSEGMPPLPVDPAEHEYLARMGAGRPVWLAADLAADEIQAVIGAHQRASRRAHRLLLILVPADKDGGEALAEKLERDGWVTALRSTGELPEPEIQVFVADLPDEMGLWYRLAPVVFMGGTLTGHAGRNPYEAAALGSAILYGPKTGRYAAAYTRLRAGGAARRVASDEELCLAMEQLLSPELAARMARAAWEISSDGAAVSDRIMELSLDLLDQRGV